MPTVNIDISSDCINAVYRPYLTDKNRYLVFYGGAGSGKSYFIAQRYIIKLLTADMCNILTVRAVGKTNRDSTFALFRQLISRWKLSKFFIINYSDLRIKYRGNGNCIIFKGLDDSEKLKSVTFENGELTDVWIEEASEVLESDFNQLDVRLRGIGCRKQIVLSFNPIDINHWLKHKFFDNDLPNAAILHTTYHDNAFLDSEYKKLLESYRDTDPYYYAVYCLGQWGVYGRTVFDSSKIQQRLDALKNDVGKKGRMQSDTEFSVCPDGDIIIYKNPVPGIPYVIGADTAGEGSDYFAAHIIDNTTGEQVAVYHAQFIDETLFAEQIYRLGKYYNDALVGIEANFSSYPIKKLQEWNYPRQYVRQSEDTFTGQMRDSYGFKTTAVTRPIIIAGLQDIVRDSVSLINDRDTLLEMLTFVRNEKGRPEAQVGAHDDLVMSLAISYYIRCQQTYTPTTMDNGKKAVWEQTQYEDYYRADDKDKEYLISKWGNPF